LPNRPPTARGRWAAVRADKAIFPDRLVSGRVTSWSVGNRHPSSRLLDMDEAKVRDLAHRIWLAEGRPDGKAEEHWERAKREAAGPNTAEGILGLAMMSVLLPIYIALGILASFTRRTD